MFERVVLVHYHEIGLKGRNRSSFENRLRLNLQSAIGGLTAEPVYRISSRLCIPVTVDANREDLILRAARIPGVSHVCDALVTGRELSEMKHAALLALEQAEDYETFRVETRRSNTDYPETSNQTNIDVGSYLVERTGKRVDLGKPDATASIEIVQGSAYVYARRVEGPGGLPVGTSGRVVALMSAGIDSPVAAWRMMKRGAVVVGVHFSGQPHTDDASIRLATEIGRRLERSEGLGRIYFVDFGETQRAISLAVPPDLRVLLYRRLMLRIAQALAVGEHAAALVTGESLGQVASQTLENIVAVDAASQMPVLRPLIGMDKNEITAEARVLGTYDVSAQQHADCCTLFMPRTPATHATSAELEAAEASLDLEGMVGSALRDMTHTDFRCPNYRPSRRSISAGTPSP
jgi:thiamine biosynthesis protein ThiI